MNKFKEGDKVKVYGLRFPGAGHSSLAVVMQNYNESSDIVHLKLMNEEGKHIGFAKAHYKQCELISKLVHAVPDGDELF